MIPVPVTAGFISDWDDLLIYIYIPGYSLVTNFFPGQIRPKGRNLGNGHLFVSFRRSRYILSTVNVFDQRFGADTPNFYRT